PANAFIGLSSRILRAFGRRLTHERLLFEGGCKQRCTHKPGSGDLGTAGSMPSRGDFLEAFAPRHSPLNGVQFRRRGSWSPLVKVEPDALGGDCRRDLAGPIDEGVA